MKRHDLRNLCAALCLGVGMCAGQALAVPIDYEGELLTDVTVSGTISETGGVGSPSDDFWFFSGVAGEFITLTVNRLESALDPGFNLYFGTGTDTGLDPLVYLETVDDGTPQLPGFGGPWSDAQLTYQLPSTGDYTVQVMTVVSGDPGPDLVYCYQITLGTPPTAGPSCDAAVPEPGSMALLGLGLFGLAGLRRRRK